MENLNKSVKQTLNELSEKENQMLVLGKKHWTLKVLKEKKDVIIESKQVQDIIDLVIENTWVQAKQFYEKK